MIGFSIMNVFRLLYIMVGPEPQPLEWPRDAQPSLFPSLEIKASGVCRVSFQHNRDDLIVDR